MKQLDLERTCEILDDIIKYELAGVVRYTHYALMISGPYRMPIVQFLQAQATESLQHAQQAGEMLTGLEGHPSLGVAEIQETGLHDIRSILEESLEHEMTALGLYKTLLDCVADASVYLEEYARTMIGTEELHTLELRKMLKDYTPV